MQEAEARKEFVFFFRLNPVPRKIIMKRHFSDSEPEMCDLQDDYDECSRYAREREGDVG